MRICELTSLRFIFAVCIFLHHMQLYPAGGAMAVTFFFVLSGFCYTIGYKDVVLSDAFSYKKYLLNKFVKFYPLHILTLFISVLWKIYTHAIISYKHLFINAFLLQSWIPQKSVYFSFNSLSWYLSDTLFFVAVFPSLMIFLSHGKRNVCMMATMMVASYSIVWACLPEAYNHAILYINPAIRLFDFVAGVLCGMLFLKLKENANVEKFVVKSHTLLGVLAFFCLLLLFCLSLILGKDLHSVYYWPFIMVLLLLISLNGGHCMFLNNKILYSLGGVSYAFYMVHVLCIQIGQKALQHLGIDNNVVLIPLLFLVSLTVAFIYTYMIQNRITQCLTKRK